MVGRPPVPETDEAARRAVAASIGGTFSSVEDLARSFIREAIIRGLYPPGHRINLDEIAETLDISRMPVRASLNQLAGEGLLKIHPRRGATVAVLRPEEIVELYELRVVLESYLIERAMDNLTDEVLDELEAIVDALEASDDLAVRLERRHDFYRTLYGCAERPRTLAIVQSLRSSVGRYLLLQRVDERHGHTTLLRHLRRGDLDSARAWLVRHLRHVSRELQNTIAAERAASTDGAPVPRTSRDGDARNGARRAGAAPAKR